MIHIERVGRGGFTLWLLLLVFAFWGGEAKGREGAHRPERAQAAGASQPLPPALRAAYLSTRQAEGGAGYAVREDAGGFVADNPAQGFSVAFSEEGVALAGAGAPRAMLKPVRFGCAGETREVGPARPEMREGRVAFPREGFVEWYANGPLGLEQGFNVEEPPRCAGTQAEALEVELGLGEGLTASLEAGGEQIALRDGAGQQVLGLSELYAIDAKGNVLPARLGVTSAHGVSMRVETAGAAYPVVIDPLVWKERQLIPSAEKQYNLYGMAVAISGDTAIVGSLYTDEAVLTVGAAYVFVRKGASWIQQAKLLPSDGIADHSFGVAVAISGDTAIVGSSSVYVKENSEIAYVFVRKGDSWSQQAKLLPSDGTIDPVSPSSIALEGDTAVIGLPDPAKPGQDTGAAYVFARKGDSWSQQAKLLASDEVAGDDFGWSVAISGDTALVGAPHDTERAQEAGAAYVFVRKGDSWSQQAKLLPSIAVGIDDFGSAVAILGDTALVGAPGNDEKGQSAGAAYAFLRQGATWSQQAKLLPSDVESNNFFGNAVALSGETALISSEVPSEPGYSLSAAYLFLHQGASWSQQTKLLVSEPEAHGIAQGFRGSRAALAGNMVIVGVPHSNAMPKEGTAHVFVLTETIPCSKDADCPSHSCIAEVCSDELAFGGCGCATRGALNPDLLGYGAMLLLGLLPLARRSARRRD